LRAKAFAYDTMEEEKQTTDNSSNAKMSIGGK
jgi:hypothetical protein